MKLSPRKARLGAASAAAALAAAALLALPTSAQADPDQDPPDKDEGVANALSGRDVAKFDTLSKGLQAKLGPRYAGAWVRGDQLVVGATSTKERAAVVRAAKAAGLDVKVEEQRFSSDQLDTTQVAIEKVISPGLIHAVGLAPQDNTVVVTTLPGTKARAERLIAKTVGAGQPVRVEEAPLVENLACDYNNGGPAYYTISCDTIRAGVRTLGDGGQCSAGFNTYSATTKKYYIATAGHCYKAAGSAVTSGRYSSGLFGIGAGYKQTRVGSVLTRYQSAVGDGALVEIEDPVAWGVRGLMHLNPTTQELPIHGYKNAVVGWLASRSGSSSGQSDGKITLVNVTTTQIDVATGKAVQVKGLVKTSADGCKGDSGGPLGTAIAGKNYALGVLSAGDGQIANRNGYLCFTNTYFTPISTLLSRHGLTLVAP